MMTFSSFRLLLLPSLTSISRQSISILGGCWHTLHSSCPLMVQCRTPLPLFMNLVTHRHRNTPEPHPLVHISETNAREIMKFEKKPNDDISKLNSCLSFDVDDQLSSAALSSYLTLNPSPLRAWCWHHSQSVRTSIAGIASLATYQISSTEFFSAKQPIFKFYSAKLSEKVKIGVNCVRV